MCFIKELFWTTKRLCCGLEEGWLVFRQRRGIKKSELKNNNKNSKRVFQKRERVRNRYGCIRLVSNIWASQQSK